MNLPEINFRASYVYDGHLKRDPKWERPAQEKFDAFFECIKSDWEKHGTEILEEISKITKLMWHEKDTTCYVTWGINPYSDPLTLNLTSNFHVLTHELIHRILSQRKNNPDQFHQNWESLFGKEGKYKDETQLCRVHIGVHAIHTAIYKKLFSDTELQANIKFSEPYEDYRRSWKIVARDGYENIIAELTKGL